MAQPRPSARRSPRIVDVDASDRQRPSMRWRGVYVDVAWSSPLVVGADRLRRPRRRPFSIAFARSSCMACVAAFLRPTIGVYLIVFLTLVGDSGDDDVVAVHQEHVESRVDHVRQRPAVLQPARGAAGGHDVGVAAAAPRRSRRGASGAGACSGRSWSSPGSSSSDSLHGRFTRRRHAGRDLRGPGRCSTSRSSTCSSRTC